MLYDEDDVEEEADIAQAEFCRVASNARPVTLEACVNEQLTEGQYASSAIKQDLINGPSHSALSCIVKPGLRHVFAEGGNKFDISKDVDLATGSARGTTHLIKGCLPRLSRSMLRRPSRRCCHLPQPWRRPVAQQECSRE